MSNSTQFQCLQTPQDPGGKLLSLGSHGWHLTPGLDYTPQTLHQPRYRGVNGRQFQSFLSETILITSAESVFFVLHLFIQRHLNICRSVETASGLKYNKNIN